MTQTRLASLAIAAALAAACAAPRPALSPPAPEAVAPAPAPAPAPRAAETAPSASFIGTRWIGVAEAGADARTLPRLEFIEGGHVAGFTGCNMLSGVWKQEGDVARMGPLATTKRLCVGPEGETEKRFLAALAEGATARHENGKLVFTAPGGARYELVEAGAA